MPYRLILGIVILAAASGMEYAPQDESALPKMVRIEWSRAPNLPQGFQDSDGGVVHDTLITMCGFASGLNNDRKPGRYPRGFLRKVWGLDLSEPSAAWQTLPDFPGAARQENFAIAVENALYCWGGFSYDEPYCYADGYRLTREDGEWTFAPLPALPYPISSAGICAVGQTIYVVGGADYDAKAFYTENDRSGGNRRLGAHMLALDTSRPENGWRRLPDCPGAPRWISGTASVGGKVYVIGGATGSPYSTVVDNWRYDPETGTWTRLRDLPIASGNFPSGAIAWRDRYILLVGGYQYEKVTNPDGTSRGPYGMPRRHKDEGAYFSDVFVYDTESGLFGRADSMPINNNLPMAVVHGDVLYLVGGETGTGVVEGEFYGHHPELCLKGALSAPSR